MTQEKSLDFFSEKTVTHYPKSFFFISAGLFFQDSRIGVKGGVPRSKNIETIKGFEKFFR